VSTYLASPLVPPGRPCVVGVVNITEDSFSDGGRYLAAEDALAHAWRLRSEGADVIELGPAASHPDAAEPSLVALAGIRHLKARFGLPVLVSPSRKSFLRTLTGRGIADSGPATLAAELHAAWQGVDYIRTHDVSVLSDALTILDAIAGRTCRRLSGGPTGEDRADRSEPS
jgi:dihydropteroate synthase